MRLDILIVPFLILTIVDCKRERTRHSGRRAVQADDINKSIGYQCELEISCKGDASTNSTKAPVKLPIKGPRGPAGRVGEKGESGEPGTPGTPGLPGKSAKKIPHVAFFVGLGNNTGPLEENTDLIFDKVITNVGDAYDVETGRFTAPFSGVYHFTIVVAARGRQKAAVMIMKDGKMVETIWAESMPSWSTSSNNAILSLTSGQQVWLVALKRAPYIHGYMYSTFSGYSLFSIDD